jgi:hypothetical protein
MQMFGECKKSGDIWIEDLCCCVVVYVSRYSMREGDTLCGYSFSFEVGVIHLCADGEGCKANGKGGWNIIGKKYTSAKFESCDHAIGVKRRILIKKDKKSTADHSKFKGLCS